MFKPSVSEEQREAAEKVGFRIDGLRVQDGNLEAIVPVDNFKEGDVFIITTPDRVASLLAQREQQAAENAARAVVEAVEAGMWKLIGANNEQKITSAYLIDAKRAASPFLREKN